MRGRWPFAGAGARARATYPSPTLRHPGLVPGSTARLGKACRRFWQPHNASAYSPLADPWTPEQVRGDGRIVTPSLLSKICGTGREGEQPAPHRGVRQGAQANASPSSAGVVVLAVGLLLDLADRVVDALQRFVALGVGHVLFRLDRAARHAQAHQCAAHPHVAVAFAHLGAARGHRLDAVDADDDALLAVLAVGIMDHHAGTVAALLALARLDVGHHRLDLGDIGHVGHLDALAVAHDHDVALMLAVPALAVLDAVDAALDRRGGRGSRHGLDLGDRGGRSRGW